MLASGFVAKDPKEGPELLEQLTYKHNGNLGNSGICNSY